ncbi:MAG: prepilin-type N-terminal cleavage/methylation domain-containing protein [Deltaproteobacteria bacterium]|nr:prepilin-type N-terminal cleavage/methylation domain-containing protein [Deltaproteobacteria bacterium]
MNGPRTKGFTLIEVIITLSVLAGGVMGVLTLYQRNIEQAARMEQTLIATQLAQEKLEQIIHDKKYQNYAYINTTNYPALPEDMGLQGFNGYTRTTTITEVSAANLTTPQNGTGYKKITVTVLLNGTQAAKLETLVTLWGEAT